jgi:hypothetical protein
MVLLPHHVSSTSMHKPEILLDCSGNGLNQTLQVSQRATFFETGIFCLCTKTNTQMEHTDSIDGFNVVKQ